MDGVNCGLQVKVKFLAGILFIFGLLLKIFTNDKKEQQNLIASLSLTQDPKFHETFQKETHCIK